MTCLTQKGALTHPLEIFRLLLPSEHFSLEQEPLVLSLSFLPLGLGDVSVDVRARRSINNVVLEIISENTNTSNITIVLVTVL